MFTWTSTALPHTVDCSTCGAALKPGARFCGQCGAKQNAHTSATSGDTLNPAPEGVTAAAVAAANEDTVRCPACGATAGGRKPPNFCRACGYRLAPHKRTSGAPATIADPQPERSVDTPAANRREHGAAGTAIAARSRRGRAFGIATLALACLAIGIGYWLAKAPRVNEAKVATSEDAVNVATPNARDANSVDMATAPEQPIQQFEPTPPIAAADPAPAAPPKVEDDAAVSKPRESPGPARAERRTRAQPSPAESRAEISTAAPTGASAARANARAATASAARAQPPAATAPTGSTAASGGGIAPAEEPYPQSAEAQPQPAPVPDAAQGRTSIEVETTVRGARTIDELYLQRTSVECGRGPFSFVCRQRIRMGLCDGKWTEVRTAGVMTCYLAPRGNPARHQ